MLALDLGKQSLESKAERIGGLGEAQSKSTKNAGNLRKKGKRGGIRGWREGRGRKELTALWKKISRAWAMGSTKAMRRVGR